MSEHTATNRTDIFHDSKEKLLRRGFQIGTVLALSSIALAGCASSHASAEPKPTHSKTAEATPTATPYVEPTPTIDKDPLPADLAPLQADTIEQFDAEPWDKKLEYVTWLENQNGITPQEAARETVLEQPKLHLTNTIASAPYPASVTPNNTPEEIMTVESYWNDVEFTQGSQLDAEKVLNAALPDGMQAPSWQFQEQLLESKYVPGDDIAGVNIAFDGTTETVDSATKPTATGDGDYQEKITWHGTSTSGNGATTVPIGGTDTFTYHEFKDYKGNTESSWF